MTVLANPKSLASGTPGALLSEAAESVFESVAREVRAVITESVTGHVADVQGLLVSGAGLRLPVGARCEIRTRHHGDIPAEVVGLRGGLTQLSVMAEATGISPGDPVRCVGSPPLAAVGHDLLGRVVDGRGEPLDGGPRPVVNRRYPLYADAPGALTRLPIDTPLGLGVRAIDGLLTAGRGQRLGIFAGTGVGKSVLMGMICRHTEADVIVTALVGERGREVRDFVERQLGPEGLQRSVVVACTSDQAAALRLRSCLYATAIAEYFRDCGAQVLLLIDSLTRVAMAQRQIGLASGEPPTVRGYPPSVYAMLPRLLERAGRTERGSITGIYTVLVEGDDVEDPLGDVVRGILDGHIWLSRALANRGHYPAIDVLNSISRVADDVTPQSQRIAARHVRRMLGTWKDMEDLVNIGAYVPGANREYDAAMATRAAVRDFLAQDRMQRGTLAEHRAALEALGAQIASVSEARAG